MLKIEKAIAVPDIRRRGGRPPCEERVAIRTMKKGESFVTRKTQVHMRTIANLEGKRIAIRSQGDGTIRVWMRGNK